MIVTIYGKGDATPDDKDVSSVRRGAYIQIHQSLELGRLTVDSGNSIHKKKSINRAKEISIPLGHTDAGLGSVISIQLPRAPCAIPTDSFNVGISTESRFTPLLIHLTSVSRRDHSVTANHALVLYRI